MLEHYGLEISVSLAAKCCMDAGEALRLSESPLPATALPANGADILVVEADGSMVPVILGQSSQGDRRKGRSLGYKEIRLLAAKDLGKADARYAAGFYEPLQAGAAWSRCAKDAGWAMATRVHGVFDGAEWIAIQHAAHFGSFGKALPDFYHVCEYLARAFPDPGEYRANKLRLLEGRCEETLRDLADLASREDPAGPAPASDALRYLSHRRGSLFYAEALAKGLPIGSGLIESGNRHVIQSRIKLAGAWWKPRNAEAMAKIRVAKANGQWESLWTAKDAA